jgi:hypothetical protein
MSKFCSLRTKNKINIFIEMKISNFILQGRKFKLAVNVGTKHISPLKIFISEALVFDTYMVTDKLIFKF